MQEYLAKAVRAAGARTVVPGRAVAMPDDYKVEDISAFAEAPWRDTKSVELLTLPELVRFVKDEGGDKGAVLFCGAGCVRAVLNYSGWADFQAVFAMVMSPEWRAWKDRDGRAFDQEGFCEFLEDMEQVIAEPRGAELVNLVANFRQNSRVEYASSYRTADGQVKLTYNESKTGVNREMAVPEVMTLRLPVLKGAEEMTTYEVRARLRVRIDKESHKLAFRYALVRPDVPEDRAVHDVAEFLRQQLPGARVHEGKLEQTPADILI